MKKHYINKLKRKGFTEAQIEEEILKLEIEYPELSEEAIQKLVFENLRYEINNIIILVGIN